MVAPTTTHESEGCMPHPYPGQQWKHDWKPVTPSAAKSKNHGRKVKPGSDVAKDMDGAIRAMSGRKNNGASKPDSDDDGGTTKSNGSTRDADNKKAVASETKAKPYLRQEAERREATNPFGKSTIARDPKNIKVGQSVFVRDKWVKIPNDRGIEKYAPHVRDHNTYLRLGSK